MPELIVGPMLRYLSDREATVWVETEAACEVEDGFALQVQVAGQVLGVGDIHLPPQRVGDVPHVLERREVDAALNAVLTERKERRSSR